jgi:hypothetical protein
MSGFSCVPRAAWVFTCLGLTLVFAGACSTAANERPDSATPLDGSARDADTTALDGDAAPPLDATPNDAKASDAGNDAREDAGAQSCFAQCEAKYPDGKSQAMLGLYNCFCNGCSAQCGNSSMCTGSAEPSATCLSCVNGKLPQCSQCGAANSSCADFTRCIQACP